MSFNQEIGAPFTLATLPKPVGFTNGRTHATTVCSISGVKKRKRTEVAVGLDGEGVFIYSLQNPQLVTSYALPPSTSFTHAPYSIYRKSASKTPAQRFTYASVSGSAQADKPQLICFHEQSVGESTETAKTAYSPASSAQIVALDALPVTAGGLAAGATHDVLATFDNGDVVCLSADLQLVRWVASLKSLGSVGGAVDHVSTATAKAVTRGFLRSREDVAAMLDSSAEDTSDLLELTQVLSVVGRKPNGTTTLTLVHIQPRSPDLATAQLSPLKHLVSWELPMPARPQAAKLSPQYSIHASSGILHIRTNAVLLSYDLSDTVPKLYSELLLPGSGIDSFLRLQQDVVMTTSQQTCRIFDSKFNTLQAIHSLDLVSTNSDAASPAKKRKLAQPSLQAQHSGRYDLVAYHSDHDLVVAIRESELVGLQIGASLTRKRARTVGTLLSDAIGKGITHSSNIDKAVDQQKWYERKARLDKYASKGKISKFEEAFAKDLGIELEIPQSPQSKQENEVNGGPMTNGVGPKIPEEDAVALDLDEEGAEDELRTWKIPGVISDARKRQSRQYASYALSKIFRPAKVAWETSSSENLLEIQFFPPNIFQWLLQTGQLSTASIRHAILEEAVDAAHIFSLISDGEVVKALVEFDPELHILSAVLNDNGFLPIGEVVQAVKVLVQSLDEQAKEAHDNTKLLTNGTAPSEEEMDVDIDSELAAANYEMDHALSVLDQGLLIRSHTLRPALIRLQSFAPALITSTLRSMMSRRDLECLVNVLHLEMRNEGWSSPYDSGDSDLPMPESANESPDDQAVAIIASLLSYTLDAIGAGAWLAGVGSPAESDSSEETIHSLHNDTSEALLGFFEARYMRGLLSEFLRYASNVPKSRKPTSESLALQGKPFAISNELGELPMLPLGGKMDIGIEKLKTGKGGKREERSKREIGIMISKKVPKYSFERIVI